MKTILKAMNDRMPRTSAIEIRKNIITIYEEQIINALQFLSNIELSKIEEFSQILNLLIHLMIFI